MADPRRCRKCRYDFTPRRLRPFARECDPCRTHFMAPHRKGRERIARDGAVHTYRPGLFGGGEAPAWQASIAGGVRRDPSKLPPDQLDAIRRRHLPTDAERAEDEAARIERDEQARRDYVLAFVATPTQAAILAATDTDTNDSEGEDR